MPQSHSRLEHPLPSSVYTLGPGVDLQPRLRHLDVAKEIHGHPDEMATNFVERGANVLHRRKSVVQVALLDIRLGQEVVVVLPVFDWQGPSPVSFFMRPKLV